MTSSLFSRSSVSRSSVQRDLPVAASEWRFVTLLVSPREVERGWVVVGRVGWVVRRWVVKRWTWARARAEERVPMRRVWGGVGVELEVWLCGLVGGGLEAIFVGGGGEEVYRGGGGCVSCVCYLMSSGRGE